MKTIYFKHLVMLFSAIIALFSNAQTSHTGMRDITGMEITADMAPGVNLWNTLDAHCSWKGDDQGLITETCWGNPYTTPEIIAGLAQRGFKTLRLPVTWYMHTGDAPDYTINPLWLDRVEEVANYAFDYDMYVIINIHHDDKHDDGTSQWLNPTHADSSQNIAQLEAMWTQIADRFKDYGDYLIFETMNEPREVGAPQEWSGGSAEHREVINLYNEKVLNVIRNSGGNNAERFVAMPQVGANVQAAIQDMVIPNNDEKVIVAVHAYSPFNFALNENNFDSWGSASDVQALQDEVQTIADNFTSKGQAVIMGEWGVIGSKPLEERLHYYDVYTEAMKNADITPIAWIYSHNRSELIWNEPELENEILKHYYPSIDILSIDIPKDTVLVGENIQAIASITPTNASHDFMIWLTNDFEKATIDQSGVITANEKGVVTVSVGVNGALAYHDLIILDTTKQINYHIEAEDFDSHQGVGTENTQDEGAGQNIGFLDEGDWSSYTVFIDSAGIYDFSARAASLSSGGWIEIEINGEYVTDLDVDATQSTGWQDWFTTGSVELDLEAGVNEIRLTYRTDDWGLYNINWYKLDFNRPSDITSLTSSVGEGISVYPNPTTGQINLGEKMNYKLIDLMGDELSSGNSDQLDLSGLSSGTYMVVTETGAAKVVKE